MTNRNKLKKIWLENFKAYKEKASLPLSPITIMIGYNGSGKTSAILGLHLLSLLAKGKSLKPKSLSRNLKKLDFSFSMEYLPHFKSDTLHLGCSIDTNFEWRNLNITFEVTPEGLKIAEETISNERGDLLYQAKKENSQKLIVQLHNEQEDKLHVENQYSVFSQLAKREKSIPVTFGSNNELLRVTREFRKVLSKIQFFYANLLDWNFSSYTRYKKLKEDGSNLPSVLYHLCKDRQIKEKILDFVNEPSTDRSFDLSFEKSPSGKIRIKQHSIPYFSEGQLRLLAVAAHLYSAPKDSLIVFDDIDSSLDAIHAKKIIIDIYNVSNLRKLQVLLTSHNPALLDAIPNEAISDVVFSYRKPSKNASSLIQIDQLDTYPELISQGPIGNLMTTGVIKRYVEERKSKEQKKADSKKWVENFSDR